MRKKLPVIFLVLLLTSVCFTSIVSVKAVGEGDWITSYTVEDAQTGQKLIEADFAISDEPTVLSPVISGEPLKVTFTVNVFTSGAGKLRLSTYMMKPSSGTYWELIPGDYDLGAGYTPNANSMEFDWAKGTFDMIAYGEATKVTRATNVTLVQLSAAGASDILDAIKVTVLTAGGSGFQALSAPQ